MITATTVIWNNISEPGMEYLTLSRAGLQLRGAGTVIQLLAGLPFRVQYEVFCDDSWRTRRAVVEQWSGDQRYTLHLSADSRGRWFSEGQRLTHLDGCVDVDLGITPFTNTLPIRRLKLAVGQSQEIRAAWVRFPELKAQPLAQRYTRLAQNRYLYENADNSFSAELEVDEQGLVITYATGWERVG